MTEIRFEGEVDGYDAMATTSFPSIGGRDVIGVLDDAFGTRKPNVRVTLGVEPVGVVPVAAGPLWTEYGFAGTDVTPSESPVITIGGWDLLDRLRDLDGREVILIVEDA